MYSPRRAHALSRELSAQLVLHVIPGGGAERRAAPVGPRVSSLARLRVRAAHWQYRVALNDRGGRCGRPRRALFA